MKVLGIGGPIVMGFLLVFYAFTIGRISTTHSVQTYLVLCTGIMSIDVGLLALALTARNR